MSDSNENYYYEIALTNRQVLVSFVVLLFCVLAAFAMGVWVGRMGQGQALAAEALPAAGPPSEIADLDSLEELRFGSQTGEEDLDKPDLGSLRGGPTRRETPGAAEGASPSRETTLVEDIGGAAPGRTPAAPPSREQAGSRPAAGAVQTPPPSGPTQRRASRPPPTTTPAPSGGEGFVVQVFSTRDEGQATKVLERLRKGGYERAFLSPVQVANQTMHRVRIGPFAERPQAEKVARAVTADYKLETWITAAGN